MKVERMPKFGPSSREIRSQTARDWVLWGIDSEIKGCALITRSTTFGSKTIFRPYWRMLRILRLGLEGLIHVTPAPGAFDASALIKRPRKAQGAAVRLGQVLRSNDPS